MKNTPPTRSNVIVLKQMLNLIPRGMINRHALETGVEVKVRTFSVLSQLSAMLFAQLSHAIGLNDVCDWMRLKSGVLARFGVTPPSKNGLSNANKDRNAEFAQKLFWSVLGHLQHASPDFAAGRKGKGVLRRFKVRIHAVRWQIYTALLVYVLLRFMAHQSEWGHSFTRLFAVTRSALWERIDLLVLLKSYGTASRRISKEYIN